MVAQSHFEWYGSLSRQELSFTEMSGRYAIQKESEKSIFLDVATKLSLDPGDLFLEVGCGLGQILIPASFVVGEAFGIDHPDVLERLSLRFPPEKNSLSLIHGNFLEIELNPKMKFDKVLVYGVLHTLPDEKSLYSFIQKATKLVAPGGKLLLGDLPNIDKKERFLSTSTGAAFQEDWIERTKHELAKTPPTADTVVFDDRAIMNIMLFLRGQSFETQSLSQSQNLPFGSTREDILATLRE